jgi:VIT1/CCC1 family predicted Fe2+/Mn2+ transporter
MTAERLEMYSTQPTAKATSHPMSDSSLTIDTTIVDVEDPQMHPGHKHFSHRAPWLRAAVLGANDGLVSVASVMLGVTAGDLTADGLHMTVLSGVSSSFFTLSIFGNF